MYCIIVICVEGPMICYIFYAYQCVYIRYIRAEQNTAFKNKLRK